jgi:hypothetical protein
MRVTWDVTGRAARPDDAEVAPAFVAAKEGGGTCARPAAFATCRTTCEAGRSEAGSSQDSRKEQTMKQRMGGFSILTAVLAALILSGPATGAATQVPFKGQSSGVVTAVGFDPVAGIAYTRVEGEGQATHLGRFTVTGDVAVTVATGIPLGTWTLTAANGDMLFLAMGGHGIDATHGFGAFTVVGGTGRFQGATGYYEQIITFAVPLGTSDIIPYTDVLEGTISFGL